ncbi:MAG TPA: hypothetical protein VEA58_01900 [Anaerovoracaceae bacterium]|nr:hypothetical protein [Anaerovoracaceae bacterium]
MANRFSIKQSDHDGGVRAAGQIYRERGKYVWTNPDGEKNQPWGTYYIDVIAADSPSPTVAWVVEIETDDSVNDAEARTQWVNYAKAYSHWSLAVPNGYVQTAEGLLNRYGITNCNVITWQHNSNGTFTFWGLPGI